MRDFSIDYTKKSQGAVSRALTHRYRVPFTRRFSVLIALQELSEPVPILGAFFVKRRSSAVRYRSQVFRKSVSIQPFVRFSVSYSALLEKIFSENTQGEEQNPSLFALPTLRCYPVAPKSIIPRFFRLSRGYCHFFFRFGGFFCKTPYVSGIFSRFR